MNGHTPFLIFCTLCIIIFIYSLYIQRKQENFEDACTNISADSADMTATYQKCADQLLQNVDTAYVDRGDVKLQQHPVLNPVYPKRDCIVYYTSNTDLCDAGYYTMPKSVLQQMSDPNAQRALNDYDKLPYGQCKTQYYGWYEEVYDHTKPMSASTKFPLKNSTDPNLNPPVNQLCYKPINSESEATAASSQFVDGTDIVSQGAYQSPFNETGKLYAAISFKNFKWNPRANTNVIQERSDNLAANACPATSTNPIRNDIPTSYLMFQFVRGTKKIQNVSAMFYNRSGQGAGTFKGYDQTQTKNIITNLFTTTLGADGNTYLKANSELNAKVIKVEFTNNCFNVLVSQDANKNDKIANVTFQFDINPPTKYKLLDSGNNPLLAKSLTDLVNLLPGLSNQINAAKSKYDADNAKVENESKNVNWQQGLQKTTYLIGNWNFMQQYGNGSSKNDLDRFFNDLKGHEIDKTTVKTKPKFLCDALGFNYSISSKTLQLSSSPFNASDGQQIRLKDQRTNLYIKFDGVRFYANEPNAASATIFKIVKNSQVFNSSCDGVALQVVGGPNANNWYARHASYTVWTSPFAANNYDYSWLFQRQNDGSYILFNWYGSGTACRRENGGWFLDIVGGDSTGAGGFLQITGFWRKFIVEVTEQMTASQNFSQNDEKDKDDCVVTKDGKNVNPYGAQFIAMVYEGYIQVPESGEYSFYINADDAADIIITDNNGVEKVVASYYGYHGLYNGGIAYTINLATGPYYKIKIRLVQGAGDIGLVVYWLLPSKRNSTGCTNPEFAPHGVLLPNDKKCYDEIPASAFFFNSNYVQYLNLQKSVTSQLAALNSLKQQYAQVAQAIDIISNALPYTANRFVTDVINNQTSLDDCASVLKDLHPGYISTITDINGSQTELMFVSVPDAAQTMENVYNIPFNPGDLKLVVAFDGSDMQQIRIKDKATGLYVMYDGQHFPVNGTSSQYASVFTIYNKPEVFNNSIGGVGLKLTGGANANNGFARHYFWILTSTPELQTNYDFAWKFINTNSQDPTYTIYNWFGSGGWYLDIVDGYLKITSNPARSWVIEVVY